MQEVKVSFEALPDEILLRVVEELGDPSHNARRGNQNLLALARTSKRLHSVTAEALYSAYEPTVYNPINRSLTQLLRTLSARPLLTRFIRTITVGNWETTHDPYEETKYFAQVTNGGTTPPRTAWLETQLSDVIDDSVRADIIKHLVYARSEDAEIAWLLARSTNIAELTLQLPYGIHSTVYQAMKLVSKHATAVSHGFHNLRRLNLNLKEAKYKLNECSIDNIMALPALRILELEDVVAARLNLEWLCPARTSSVEILALRRCLFTGDAIACLVDRCARLKELTYIHTWRRLRGADGIIVVDSQMNDLSGFFAPLHESLHSHKDTLEQLILIDVDQVRTRQYDDPGVLESFHDFVTLKGFRTAGVTLPRDRTMAELLPSTVEEVQIDYPVTDRAKELQDLKGSNEGLELYSSPAAAGMRKVSRSHAFVLNVS